MTRERLTKTVANHLLWDSSHPSWDQMSKESHPNQAQGMTAYAACAPCSCLSLVRLTVQHCCDDWGGAPELLTLYRIGNVSIPTCTSTRTRL